MIPYATCVSTFSAIVIAIILDLKICTAWFLASQPWPRHYWGRHCWRQVSWYSRDSTNHSIFLCHVKSVAQWSFLPLRIQYFFVFSSFHPGLRDSHLGWICQHWHSIPPTLSCDDRVLALAAAAVDADCRLAAWEWKRYWVCPKPESGVPTEPSSRL